MGVVDTLLRKTSRGRARYEAARIGGWVREDPDAGLLQLARFVETLDDVAATVDQRILALDLLSAILREASVGMVAALRAQPLPLQPEALSRLHRLFRGFRVVRDALRRVYGEVLTPESAGTGADAALTVLAHALGMQSQLLATACQVRVGLARDDWDELCRLAWPLWRANQLDEPSRPGKEGSAVVSVRAALVEPVLLRLLEPLGLTPMEWDLALDEARRAAGAVGVRIELDGNLNKYAEGPALMVSADYSLQLDTRAAAHDLRMRLAMIHHGASLADARVRAPLSRQQVREVMERLAVVWGAGYTPEPLVRPPLPRALIHFGLPAPSKEQVAAAPQGRGEEGLPDPALQAIAAQSETVIWRGLDARRAVFSRSVPTPRIGLGQLVAVLPWRLQDGRMQPPLTRPGSGPTGLMMGRIVTLTHLGSPNSRQPFAHDLGVVFWSGTPQRVVWQRTGRQELEQGWCLPGTTTEPPSLIMRRDAFDGPADARCVGKTGPSSLSFLRLIERGPDFDRVELAPVASALV